MEVCTKIEKWCARLCFGMFCGHACCVLEWEKGVENINMGLTHEGGQTQHVCLLETFLICQMYESKNVHGEGLFGPFKERKRRCYV